MSVRVTRARVRHIVENNKHLQIFTPGDRSVIVEDFLRWYAEFDSAGGHGVFGSWLNYSCADDEASWRYILESVRLKNLADYAVPKVELSQALID